MDDPTSDIDLVMHVAHQQHYWLKRQENDRNRVTKQYLDHVIEYLTNAESVSQLLTAWRSQILQDVQLQIQMREILMSQMKKRKSTET